MLSPSYYSRSFLNVVCSHLFAIYYLPSLLWCFLFLGVSAAPRGNHPFLQTLLFSHLYFRAVSLKLPSPSPPSPSLSLRFFFKFLPFVLSLAASLYAYVSSCGKNPALGLHRLFHVRTSGDIKASLRGLSVCISSAPTVCA